MEINKDRNSNFELMRIISMIFIVLGHILLHGNLIINCDNAIVKYILQFLQYIIIIHVNSFVLLSGYFQSKSNFKLTKFLGLLIQVMFYNMLILAVGIKLGLIQNYDSLTFINRLFFSSVNEYWFIKMYIVVYLMSNIINKFIECLNKKSYQKVLILVFFIFSVMSFITGGKFFVNDGYNFYNFIFLYLIGGYLRRYNIKEIKISKYRVILILVFFLMAIINFSLVELAYFVNDSSGIVYEISNRILNFKLLYSTPFVIIQTISYFLFFETLKLKNKTINFLSSCVFGVYLFHENSYVRLWIYKFLKIDSGDLTIYNIFLRVLLGIIFIFVVGIVIEIVRKLLFRLLLRLKPIKIIKEKLDVVNHKLIL